MTYLDRVPAAFRPVIAAAWMHLPQRVIDMVNPHFLCGANPNFVGLHPCKAFNDEWAARGHGYDYVAHAVYAHLSADGVPRIVFPTLAAYQDPISTVIHEVGHLFDERTGFQLSPPVTTAYSKTNRQERVAEAFEVCLRPENAAWADFAAAESFRPFRDAIGMLA